MFDSVKYFESRNIEYWTEGKNVTSGWTNINCLFCQDHSNHLGVSPQDFFNCHMCGESGHVTKLITHIDRCSYSRAARLVSLFQTSSYETEQHEIPSSVKLPGSIKFPTRAKRYLKKRGFDPGTIISKYQLRWGGITGKHKFRIIVPFYYLNKLVTYSSLDITGKQKLKYVHQSKKDAIINAANCIYNIDSIKDKMILVEGFTDAWTGGNGFCSKQGKRLTDMQLDIIMRKGVKEALVFNDSDAVKEGKKVATQLSGVINSVEYVEYDGIEGDPNSIPIELIKQLRKEFL